MPALLGLALLIGGCVDRAPLSTATDTPPSSEAAQCVPDCAARACGPDGCGGTCGACPDAQVCTIDGACITPADSPLCQLGCSDLGLECGEHCGVSCGECAPGATCEKGHCTCSPDCTGKQCGDGDGCGGVCECPIELSCAGCVLTLSVVETETAGDAVRFVTLAVDYAPPADAPAPTMADVRLALKGPARLQQVGVGAGVFAAGKQLLRDPTTGRPWRDLADGSVQVVLFSTASTEPIPPGRWLVLKFQLGEAFQPAVVPASFRLVAREQILAPPKADQVLWGQTLDSPVVVWPFADGGGSR